MYAYANPKGHLITVRMTPAVYKFLKDEPSSLEDLKVENPALFRY